MPESRAGEGLDFRRDSRDPWLDLPGLYQGVATEGLMLRRIILAALIAFMFGGRAMADATADAKGVGEAFQKAMEACDVSSVLDLYEDDAVVIWPGQGEEAKGKEAIGKIATIVCKQKVAMKPVSNTATSIGSDYIVNVGTWEMEVPGPDGKPAMAKLRTTEILRKTNGKWRYVVDHASVGTPPAAPASTAKSAAP